MRIALLGLIFTVAALATTPTADDLEAALENARIAWQYDIPEPIEFRMDALNPCDLHKVSNVAVTQVIDIATALHFPEGPDEVSHELRYIIRINSNCNWDRLPLQTVITHEYGHLLLGTEYHSSNPRSIMFYVVDKCQAITAEERSLLTMRRPS